MKFTSFVPLLLFLVMLGCTQERVSVSNCDSITDQYEQYRCYLSTAEQTRDSSLCRNPLYVPWKDECLYGVAKASQDASVCSKIVGQGTKDLCYYHLGQLKQDPSLCNNMNDKRYKDDCYFEIAVSKKNPDSCKYLYYGERKLWCYREIAHMVRNPDICSKIENENYSDECYKTIAEFNSDPTVCDRMKPGWGRDYCYEDSIYYMPKRDISVCDKIERKEIRESCQRIVTSNTKFGVNNDTTECSLGSWNYYLGDVWVEPDGGTCSCTRFATYCYGGVLPISIGTPATTPGGVPVATITKVGPEEKCGKVPILYYKDICYNLLAEDEKDPKICELIQNQTMKESCRSAFLKTECDSISSQYDKDSCYEDLAKSKLDPTICEKITSKTSKDLCYSAVAKVKKDSSLCGKIQQEIYKELCLAYFARTER